jgi:Na+/H+ antiporter NhaA
MMETFKHKRCFNTYCSIREMIVPAGKHLWLNYGTDAQTGAGIPMATDIAFALVFILLEIMTIVFKIIDSFSRN